LRAFNTVIHNALKASKGIDKLKYHPKIERMEWLEDYDNGRSPLLHGTKSLMLRDVLKASPLKEAPKDKTIIFTEWKGFTAIAGRILEQEGVEFVYYTVSTSPHILIVNTCD
jgi:hypothetical protein